MSRYRILIVGAYGQFGGRIASALSGDPALCLLLAGRSLARSMACRDALERNGARAELSALALDVDHPGFAGALQQLHLDLVVHTAGPFQQRDYRVAEAALVCGAHYIDLADARSFVAGIGRLDAQARSRQRWVISGASSVPGLSAAVVEAYVGRFAQLDSVETAIGPGNRTARGLATTKAILGYVGRPFPALIHGQWRQVHGWQSQRRWRGAGVGTRWFGRCDVPDLELLPSRYPQLRNCDFRAGLELRRMHFGLWLASWVVRARLLAGLERWSDRLLRLSNRWLGAGSDTGVMLLEMRGRGHDGSGLLLRWQLLASQGSGPQVPATAAVVLARKLASGALPGSGARACMDLFTLEEFMRELENFPVQVTLEADSTIR